MLKWNFKNYFNDYKLFLQQNFIEIDDKKYISEVEDLLKYFYKIKHTNSNRKLVYIIFKYFGWAIVFYYYQGTLFDVSINIQKNIYLEDNITREEEFTNLEAPLNSSILSKTLEEGSQIKKLIFFNTNDNVIKYPVFNISFSANTLTIEWNRIGNDDNLKYLKILFELWPELILKLKKLEYWDEKRLNWIQRLLIYCEGSSPCWKLFFSKVVIDIDIDKIDINFKFFVELNKLKHLYYSLSKIYDVELENITYEDFFIKLF